MRALIFVAALALGVSGASALAATEASQFVWPIVKPGAIPDLRIAAFIKTARENARSAATRAEEGRRAAAQTHRHEALLGLVGAKPHSATIDDETTVTTAGINGRLGRFGTINYDSGATMTGLIADGTGLYRASPESPLAQFSGWVFGATRSTPQPMDGQFNFRNGDTFMGSSGTGYGVYTSANEEIRFVGKIDFENYPLHPVIGAFEDRQGRLLANVNDGGL